MNSRDVLIQEAYQVISKRIALYISETTKNVISVEELVFKMNEDTFLNPQFRNSWLILQIKNEMVEKSLLYVSFDKPLQQHIGLTLRGKAVFQIY